MLFRLENQVKHYEWGSPEDIPRFLGVKGDGRPWAELWMGTHPGGASRTVLGGRGLGLGELVAEDPGSLLGKDTAERFGGLPFLLKLLAAEQPLSIQAHPNLAQAREGFERENRAGIPPGDEGRNYRDANHKPEILCALGPFTALCGFREPSEISRALEVLFAPAPASLRRALDSLQRPLGGTDPLRNFLAELFRFPEGGRRELAAYLSQAPFPGSAELAGEQFAGEWDRMVQFSGLYPGDPGTLAPLYLNLIRLEAGEAVYLPAGVLHAYVHGFGVELMANSDNVLRGGLTRKHIDVPELLGILDFSPFRPAILLPRAAGDGRFRYAADCGEFSLSLMRGEGAPLPYPEKGPAIFVVAGGRLSVRGEGGEEQFCRGESAFIPSEAGRGPLFFSGDYRLYLAALGTGNG